MIPALFLLVIAAGSVDEAALGKRLFLDPRLSADSTVSCASCHQPEKAFTDGRTVSLGISSRQGNRNTPTLVNRAGGLLYFWDGRAATLEEQVLMPIQDPNEMGMNLDDVVGRFRSDGDYRAQFLALFGREINAKDLARALASYVRTIRSSESPFDRYLRGAPDALSGLEREGLRLFRDKANCTACHSGPDFTDEAFHNTGVSWREGRIQDEGRYALTRLPFHHGAFKTPTLREIARTAPYMHDGSLATLEDVVEFYDRGDNAHPWLDEQVKPLHLSAAEKQAIVAFLRFGLNGAP